MFRNSNRGGENPDCHNGVLSILNNIYYVSVFLVQILLILNGVFASADENVFKDPKIAMFLESETKEIKNVHNDYKSVHIVEYENKNILNEHLIIVRWKICPKEDDYIKGLDMVCENEMRIYQKNNAMELLFKINDCMVGFEFIDMNNDGVDEIYIHSDSGGMDCCKGVTILKSSENNLKTMFGAPYFANPIDINNDKIKEMETYNKLDGRFPWFEYTTIDIWNKEQDKYSELNSQNVSKYESESDKALYENMLKEYYENKINQAKESIKKNKENDINRILEANAICIYYKMLGQDKKAEESYNNILSNIKEKHKYLPIAMEIKANVINYKIDSNK